MGADDIFLDRAAGNKRIAPVNVVCPLLLVSIVPVGPYCPVPAERVELAQVISSMRLKLLFAFCSIGCLVAVGQDASQGKKIDKTVAKPMTDKQKRKQQDRL